MFQLSEKKINKNKQKTKINVLFGVFPNQTKSDLDEVLRFCRENRKGYRDNST